MKAKRESKKGIPAIKCWYFEIFQLSLIFSKESQQTGQITCLKSSFEVALKSWNIVLFNPGYYTPRIQCSGSIFIESGSGSRGPLNPDPIWIRIRNTEIICPHTRIVCDGIIMSKIYQFCSSVRFDFSKCEEYEKIKWFKYRAFS